MTFSSLDWSARIPPEKSANRKLATEGSTWSCNARFLSEVVRRAGPDRSLSCEAGALSIRALEVSRWRGVLDASTYGF
jgi:hypothetical protein